MSMIVETKFQLILTIFNFLDQIYLKRVFLTKTEKVNITTEF